MRLAVCYAPRKRADPQGRLDGSSQIERVAGEQIATTLIEAQAVILGLNLVREKTGRFANE